MEQKKNKFRPRLAEHMTVNEIVLNSIASPVKWMRIDANVGKSRAQYCLLTKAHIALLQPVKWRD